MASVDSTVSYDTGWLVSHGWVTTNGGITYAFTGTYGTATLDLATNVVTYLLNNARSATNALAVGQIVTEPFTIQVITASGITAQATVRFSITGSADAPTVTVSRPSKGLIEAGASGPGIGTATATFKMASVDSTVSYDTGWLVSHGWVTTNGGITYAFNGTYGTATLNLATNIVTYVLDNARPATKAIAVGQIVTEPFTIQVITASGITAQATVKFSITVNSDKASDLAEGRSN